MNVSDDWILNNRPVRHSVNALRPYNFLVEEECGVHGFPQSVATIFLTNRECPWRCLMCDLWRNTLESTVPKGAIAGQVQFALERLGPAQSVKLYNSGSFFDLRAIPIEDYEAVAAQLNGFERVIVESHPALIGERTLMFRDLLSGTLEVAVGLETVDPAVLPRLNKGMTLRDFERAAHFLCEQGIALRAFILVKPPFQNEEEALHWACRSVDFAFACGASAVSLIPVRGGNGAMDNLQREGHFSTPRLCTLERAVRYGLDLHRGRVFADVWDLANIAMCRGCSPMRVAALQACNLTQSYPPREPCPECAQ